MLKDNIDKYFKVMESFKKESIYIIGSSGQPGWLRGLALPSIQGVTLETQDGVPRWVPCMELASPSACVSVLLSLSLCLMNK